VEDNGDADPRLALALAAYDGGDASRSEALAALVTARVFIAITASATAEETAGATGLRSESGAEMALVSIVASDGERAVPAFLDTAALKRWRLDARPVAVTGSYLAGAALEDGAAAVLLDPAGAAVVVRADELAVLADGYVPVAGAPLAARRTTAQLTDLATDPPTALVQALRAALRPERLRAARLLAGPDGSVLGVAPRTALDATQLAALAQRVRARLGPALPVQGLDLAVVPPEGPGHPLLSRRFGRIGRSSR
jgi:hypothetical protein